MVANTALACLVVVLLVLESSVLPLLVVVLLVLFVAYRAYLVLWGDTHGYISCTASCRRPPTSPGPRSW